MSIGGLIGAIAGGVIGFIIGGPGGAIMGASLGFSLGMMIDPMTPDIKNVGNPVQPIQIMSNEIGEPVADLLGTGKIVGHLLFYGAERSVVTYEKVKGGKGGKGKKQVVETGHKYYCSWGLGICAGPVDTVYTIFNNEKVVWEGEVNRPTSGGVVTIAIEDMGSVDLYFGTDDQIANSKIASIIPDATLNSPHRGMVWAFFDDCYIGTFNRVPTMRFVVRRSPTFAFSDEQLIQTYDYNAAHSIWYILHWLTELPESWLNTVAFQTLADLVLAEKRGISLLMSGQQTVESYLEIINNHMDMIIKYGSDGKFHPKAIRDDYVIANLESFDESIMLDKPIFARKSWIDTINEIKVQYSQIIRPECHFWDSGNASYASGILAVSVYADGVYSCGSRTSGYGAYGEWMIEKRNKSTGGIIWEKFEFINEQSYPPLEATGIKADGSGVFVVGFAMEGLTYYPWMIQKRSRTNGNVIWEQDYYGQYACPYAVTTDSDSVYIGGVDTGPFSRLEKRNKSDGELVWVVHDAEAATMIRAICAYGDSIYTTGFCQNTSGWRTTRRLKSNGSIVWEKEYNFYAPGYNVGRGIWADYSGLYVTGTVEASGGPTPGDWGIEKRALANGEQDWNVIYNPTGNYEYGFCIVGDDVHIYVGGVVGAGWMLNKRLKVNGELVWGLPTVAGDLMGVDVDECGIYCGGRSEGLKRITKRNYDGEL